MAELETDLVSSLQDLTFRKDIAPGARRVQSSQDLARFYNCLSDSDQEQPEEPPDKPPEIQAAWQPDGNSNTVPNRKQSIEQIVQHKLQAKKLTKRIRSRNRISIMDSKKEVKGSSDKLVEALLKSEMKKNTSLNDLAKENHRVDSGKRWPPTSGSPDNDDEETDHVFKNPKKLRVFKGDLENDLPPLNSKIVRIFTSSTFTGK